MEWWLNVAAIKAATCGNNGFTKLRGERRVRGGGTRRRGGDGVEACCRWAVGCRGAGWRWCGGGGGGVNGEHVEA